MQVSQSVKFAALLVLLIVLYFLVRGLFNSPDETSVNGEQARFSVVTQDLSTEDWQAEIVVRGRSAAKRKVIVRAEIAGAVAATPTAQGAPVTKGDVLCQIEINARQAALAEAEAAHKKARLDYDAAVKLSQDGFRSETAVAAAKAALDLTAANKERAGITLDKTHITAPFDGVFDQRHVEVGDFVSIGDPCGTVIQHTPFLAVGAVAEKDVAKINIGDQGVARLATGEVVEGVVRFIAAAADPATRTFAVELEIPNEEGALRDGVTTDFTIFARERKAHRIPRSSLTLNDRGEVGVRTIEGDGKVQFYAVRLLGEDASGVWVGGLDDTVKLIVRGQDFVSAGQTVDIVDADDLAKAEAGP